MEAAKNAVERKSLEQREKMSEIERLRHSAAHIMAAAVLRLWPNAKLDIGPATEEGFYYDFDLPDHRFTPDDFPKIEEEMRKIVKENHRFEKFVKTREEAKALLEQKGQTYKIDRLNDIPEGEPISFYQSGEFVDLCAGPHVMRTGNVKAFKLLRVAAAYYRGNEKNPQLQRIYGTAFPTKAELEEWLKAQEEAKKRDHRRIGKEMQIFLFDDDVGPGLPLWMPNGAVIAEELEKLAKETEFLAGYVRVRTPHLAKESMYLTSGHLPYYAESMFPPMELKEYDENGQVKSVEKYYLKAMNCPHHHKIFAAVPRSYRDLPLRLAEYGTCYRYEKSGELMGLMRVRSMQMNDAHIYCTPEQFADEFKAVNEMYLKYFKIFGFKKYLMRFSTHDPSRLGQKYVNEPELWLKTEEMVRKVLNDSGIEYVEVPNEAAFYGPKIDVQIWSISGREFTIATNQVDFAVPRRFGLVYRDKDNTDKTPIVIHRAPLGTHERFIGFLIEHYAGNFPLWLAPEQVRVLPVTENQIQYAEEIVKQLRSNLVRATIEFSNDKLQGRILRAEEARAGIMLIVGQREQQAGTVAVRIHTKGDQGAHPLPVVIDTILNAIKERTPEVVLKKS
ncbi:MAG: threonine--tRNA ligase [Verrucomicrobiia bacterium]